MLTNSSRARSSSGWPRNRLLLALPSRNLKRLMPELEQIRCQRAQVLMNADSSLDYVFFPNSGVVSVVGVYADGRVIEMATIGREGCTDVQAILGAIEQVMVSAACNGAHSLKQRLARWLLMMRDRSDGDALLITQSLLAEMLGVQRPSISNAARELEHAGLIQLGRRQVTILDRQGLTKASCECYQLVRSRLAFHLPKTYG
jgi:hypothetical protein